MTDPVPVHDILLPALGEGVDGATVTVWLKSIGDHVVEDEPLFEISTDKVDSEVPSPSSGQLLEILVSEGDRAEVGAVIARMGAPGSVMSAANEPSGPAAIRSEPEPAEVHEDKPAPADDPSAYNPETSITYPSNVPVGYPLPLPAGADDDVLLSPAVSHILAKYNLQPAQISATGHGGRITRLDAETAVGAAQEPTTAEPSAPDQSTVPVNQDDRDFLPLNRIRSRTAEHMVRSKATAPHALTAIEVDFENIERARTRHREHWKHTEGFSLTYLPFILRALGCAIRDYPLVNGSFVGGGVALNPTINVAIAVDLEFDGLIAPVVRAIDDKRTRKLARDIVDVAARARSGKLRLDDLHGGTFTVTNSGQYGTMMQFPIINQPQVAILSTDSVQRKPVVTTDAHGQEGIAIHSVGVLAMAWDHRAIDGAYAAAFLDRLRHLLQSIDWEPELK